MRIKSAVVTILSQYVPTLQNHDINFMITELLFGTYKNYFTKNVLTPIKYKECNVFKFAGSELLCILCFLIGDNHSTCGLCIQRANLIQIIKKENVTYQMFIKFLASNQFLDIKYKYNNYFINYTVLSINNTTLLIDKVNYLISKDFEFFKREFWDKKDLYQYIDILVNLELCCSG
jgi:hypothetical protein